MGSMDYYVYILSNETNVAIYTGVTNDLIRRVAEHRSHNKPNSFTAKYNIHKLVYYEHTNDIKAAIAREKQIKTWNRKRKNSLVDNFNPLWLDLYSHLIE